MASHRPLFGLLFAGLCAVSAPAFAQSTHVRGTVASISGDTMVVKSAAGQDTAITLAPGWKAIGVAPSKLSAIKPGEFVGIASTGPEDHLVAREVVVFPPAMKGAGEGHYKWDLGPQSMMTSATVATEVTKADGRELTLTYAGGEKQVVVPQDVPVVTLEPGDQSLVKQGAKVVVSATSTNGAMTAKAVLVGKDGLTPPM